jgi:hypothetical protein
MTINDDQIQFTDYVLLNGNSVLPGECSMQKTPKLIGFLPRNGNTTRVALVK